MKKITAFVSIILFCLVFSGSSVDAQKSLGSNKLLTPEVSATIVISQVYGGGGNAGSTYTHDFIELHNRGNITVDVTGWTVQYASATGTTWATTTLSGTIAPGKYYLIQEAMGAGGSTPLPTPEATGAIAMSATAGKVALVNTITALTGACPTGAQIIDFVGYGLTANCFEGTGATPAPSNTVADIRVSSGNIDTDQNNVDFATGAPTPRNSANPATAANASIGGQITNANGRGIGNVIVTLAGGELTAPRIAITNPFGYYNFDGVEVGSNYVVSVSSKRYMFNPSSRVINVDDNVGNADFVSEP